MREETIDSMRTWAYWHQNVPVYISVCLIFCELEILFFELSTETYNCRQQSNPSKRREKNTLNSKNGYVVTENAELCKISYILEEVKDELTKT